MRLTHEAYLIGSGRFGHELTDELDCHVYAIDGGDEVAIIDAGLGRQTEKMLAILRADGLDPARISTIILTHAHGDHAGGLARLRALTGARVLVPAEAVPWVEAADEVKTSLAPARAAGIYPADYAWQPCPVDRALHDGDTMTVGRLSLRVVETPGHARGHCAYLFEGRAGPTLVSGDLVFHGGRVVMQNIWDCSIQETAASLERLANLGIVTLLAGHGIIPVTGGQQHIDKALHVFRRLGVPM